MSDAPKSLSSDDPIVLTAADLMKQRNESVAELVKALLIINGGGAVALLAFLQAIWIPSRVLAKPIAIGISFLAFGALLAAAFHLFRHQASWYHQKGEKEQWAKFRRFYLFSASVSLLAFVAGIGVVVVGVLGAL